MKLEPEGDPYADGVSAGWRQDRYAGCKDAFIDCPWPEGTPEASEWDRGFGDGTEDFIAYQRSD
jgi:hypothetical protein